MSQIRLKGLSDGHVSLFQVQMETLRFVWCDKGCSYNQYLPTKPLFV